LWWKTRPCSSAPAEALDEDTEVFALESDTASVQVVAPEQPFDPDGLDDALLQPLLGAVRDAPMESMAWQVALEIAQELVPCEAGSVLRMEADGGLRFMSATGPEAHKLAGVTLPPGKGIVGFCATRRMGLIVNNPARDRRFYREMDEATGFATRSLLCVPIHAGGRTAGCLELLNPPEGAPFSKVHLDRIEPVARALGLRLAALA
jgi:transcriptional regulator with GAF, ATPase, and Fis domain